ncbi:hypothetical protein RF11_00242 [Thelohanellus kitauei]|uniref:Uncharacterized protein n=1 Tax=Thelohanellus kitauei TaxID=669202 RepID=A0A0C2NL63_THEKT|nr:hypothetical protein RF11_00242 [Thelohanellus kitauei]
MFSYIRKELKDLGTQDESTTHVFVGSHINYGSHEQASISYLPRLGQSERSSSTFTHHGFVKNIFEDAAMVARWIDKSINSISSCIFKLHYTYTYGNASNRMCKRLDIYR